MLLLTSCMQLGSNSQLDSSTRCVDEIHSALLYVRTILFGPEDLDIVRSHKIDWLCHDMISTVPTL